jgi:hypothetical protein
LLARCVGCRTSRALLTLKDACLCEVCRRLLVNEVKHCIFDPVEGASVYAPFAITATNAAKVGNAEAIRIWPRDGR